MWYVGKCPEQRGVMISHSHPRSDELSPMVDSVDLKLLEAIG